MKSTIALLSIFCFANAYEYEQLKPLYSEEDPFIRYRILTLESNISFLRELIYSISLEDTKENQELLRIMKEEIDRSMCLVGLQKFKSGD